jgi:hypothetical protein
MKPLLRLCLLLVLALALPINGMASRLMSAHSPHQPVDSTHAMASLVETDHGALALDECDGGQTTASDAQTCKPGLDCKSGGLLQVGAGKATAPLFGQPGPSSLSSTSLLGQSEPLWHPPRV